MEVSFLLSQSIESMPDKFMLPEGQSSGSPSSHAGRNVAGQKSDYKQKHKHNKKYSWIMGANAVEQSGQH
jgi:hypothetical protein